ncbi:hypothetical protein FACS1894111_04290 [Clostridia bacterium]|nr:hypothetical protein FACS1894111_04290 [Clostridia bacterium]
MTNSENKYSVTQYPVSAILGFIEAGAIAIPEIQRPFVWKGRQVRNLVDSLYNGYPTGYLIIWHNSDVKLKNGETSVGKKILIDGQQRITALMTAIGGHSIITEDYEEKPIKIAFNPLAVGEEDKFAVQTPAHLKSKHWIPDISPIFKSDFNSWSFVNEYISNNPEVSPELINNKITKLQHIKNSQLGCIELIPDLDIGEVTEIFVRINSQGKNLNSADFAMSKIAADEQFGGNVLRKAIDYFCHLAIKPGFFDTLSKDTTFVQSEYFDKIKWLKNNNDDIYDPDFNDMLRVAFMHIFRRAKLGDLVKLLSGRDFKERIFKEEIMQESFEKLRLGVLDFINQYSFEQFVLAIKSAGFAEARLIGSKMTLDFAYALYLILQKSANIKKTESKRYVQKWFVYSTLTSRYIGSPETRMNEDLRQIETKGFTAFLSENESLLSDTFWSNELVSRLETSSISSPYFNVFLAAQIFLKDNSLFSSGIKVGDLINVGDVHHIFPRQHLIDNGISDKALYNQVANYTYLDTSVNIKIGKKKPTEYFKDEEIKVLLGGSNFEDNLTQNAIPLDITNMSVENYQEFLSKRRKLMAEKIKKYYYSL